MNEELENRLEQSFLDGTLAQAVEMLAEDTREIVPSACLHEAALKLRTAATKIAQLTDALRSAHNVMGTTTDALESGEPSRHHYAKQRLEREMDSIRAALSRERIVA